MGPSPTNYPQGPSPHQLHPTTVPQAQPPSKHTYVPCPHPSACMGPGHPLHGLRTPPAAPTGPATPNPSQTLTPTSVSFTLIVLNTSYIPKTPKFISLVLIQSPIKVYPLAQPPPNYTHRPSAPQCTHGASPYQSTPMGPAPPEVPQGTSPNPKYTHRPSLPQSTPKDTTSPKYTQGLSPYTTATMSQAPTEVQPGAQTLPIAPTGPAPQKVHLWVQHPPNCTDKPSSHQLVPTDPFLRKWTHGPRPPKCAHEPSPTPSAPTRPAPTIMFI
ncbi:uncharacterized protein LOC134376671 [Cynocephalus volans]|uniref:uncharacterized protein LOC134376671 n=1 Tax=Cynocephalus volans TaxID=110931 RepID=UPI002FC7EEFC